MKRYLTILSSVLLSFLVITGCGTGSPTLPAIHNESLSHLDTLITQCSNISALYYEEVPLVSHYSGGVKIENTTRVWLKDHLLKTEVLIQYYKNDQPIDTEIIGELYDYSLFKHSRYYIGNYPDQMQSIHNDNRTNLSPPRDQTVLWYLDRVNTEAVNVEEGYHEGEKCFVVEILKNNYGSTKLWICKDSGLPLKTQTQYHNHISERQYTFFKYGEGSVSDEDFIIPSSAIIF